MTPQQTIAHYRVTSKLGAGGMGEVWRATDTQLNRDVAIKIIPETFAANPDRMARFAREAQVLASLNHPNIAAIYGIEERALVMELVEGPTLAERIALGAISVDEAMPIAKQIADALEYAHERGIVHRDLKPANIKITPEGRVKVLDFGLAKAMSAETAPGAPADSPTLTMRATVAGTIIGTAAYMAPEQARGHAVDRRADIWAFGVVLYEMLTGGTLFEGPTVSDTLASVLKSAVDLRAVPAQLRPAIERCLRRDPKLRWRSIGDVFLALEERSAPTPARRSAMPWAVAAILAIAAAAGWVVAWRAAQPVDHLLTRLSVDLGPGAMTGLNLTAAISPDGRRLVFPARGPDGKQQFATRLLDQAEPTLLAGTEGASYPFFSPDGQWIGFFANSQVKKIAVSGGAPIRICGLGTTGEGGSWGEDGYIVAGVGPAAPLSRIPAAAGEAQLLTKLGPGGLTHRWPQVLPGGIVIFKASAGASAMENANIEAVSVKTGQVKVLQRGGYYGRYLPSGHLVYLHQGTLFGVPFDLERLEERGTPAPILYDVAADGATGGGQFDFSWGAVRVWNVRLFGGEERCPGMANRVVGWLRQDAASCLQARAYSTPRVSPDGRKLAFIGEGSDIYILDEQRDTTTRLRSTAMPMFPCGRRMENILRSPPPAPACFGFAAMGAENLNCYSRTRVAQLHGHFLPMAAGWHTSGGLPQKDSISSLCRWT